MEADCQWKNLIWRLSPSRGLGRKINEQDRSSIESEDKSRCSDRYFGFFFVITVEIAQSNGNAYCKIHTIMWLGHILGPISSFLKPFSLFMRHMRMAYGLPNPWVLRITNLWYTSDWFLFRFNGDFACGLEFLQETLLQ